MDPGQECVFIPQMPERKPMANGVLDTRLGVSNKTAMCSTCHQKLAECTGHFGALGILVAVLISIALALRWRGVWRGFARWSGYRP